RGLAEQALAVDKADLVVGALRESRQRKRRDEQRACDPDHEFLNSVFQNALLQHGFERSPEKIPDCGATRIKGCFETAHDSTVTDRRPHDKSSRAQASFPDHLLEYGPDLKLEMLDPVGDLRVERIAVAEFQRADRRVPGKSDADRIPERLEGRLEAVVVDLAGIGKYRQAAR